MLSFVAQIKETKRRKKELKKQIVKARLLKPNHKITLEKTLNIFECSK